MTRIFHPLKPPHCSSNKTLHPTGLASLHPLSPQTPIAPATPAPGAAPFRLYQAAPHPTLSLPSGHLLHEVSWAAPVMETSLSVPRPGSRRQEGRYTLSPRTPSPRMPEPEKAPAGSARWTRRHGLGPRSTSSSPAAEKEAHKERKDLENAPSRSANPFHIPEDVDFFLLREQERKRAFFERQQKKVMQVHQKMTYSSMMSAKHSHMRRELQLEDKAEEQELHEKVEELRALPQLGLEARHDQRCRPSRRQSRTAGDPQGASACGPHRSRRSQVTLVVDTVPLWTSAAPWLQHSRASWSRPSS
uniref:Uncharacterized protein n=1 Tax=Oryctolagus cuniculus TaxID=9986 RepID=A0A5F9CXE1_RABIT